MNQINTGGPAFPKPYSGTEMGMTLRDYFAAKAMQAIIQANTMRVSIANELQSNCDKEFVDKEAECLAEGAYQMADAMLRMRKE